MVEWVGLGGMCGGGQWAGGTAGVFGVGRYRTTGGYQPYVAGWRSGDCGGRPNGDRVHAHTKHVHIPFIGDITARGGERQKFGNR